LRKSEDAGKKVRAAGALVYDDFVPYVWARQARPAGTSHGSARPAPRRIKKG